jgi:hypothetical protein
LLGQHAPYPRGRHDRLLRGVGAQDPLAGAQRDGLDHAREPGRLGRLSDVVVRGLRGHDFEPGLGDVGG